MNVTVFNRQRAVALDLPQLLSFAQEAGAACARRKHSAGSTPASLDKVEVSLVSDRRIAALHWQFLQIRGATDVLTFEHGEMVISAETAVRAARAHGEKLEREVARYIVHGLLHLRGYSDAAPAVRARMWRVQEAILHQLWPAAAAGKS